jgi:3-phosphoshikimate 1-carboxyvinyltransferase
VVGLGLIGGSFAGAIRRAGLCRRVLGWDRDPRSRDIACERQVVDDCPESLLAAAAEAHIVMLAVPILAVRPVLEDLVKALGDAALQQRIITDVASAKGCILAAAQQVFGRVPSGLVPGHPIAGSECSGITAADADLFVQHKVILTPHPAISQAAMQTVTGLWQATGAQVLCMDVQRHDEVLAVTSHLPHLLAFSLVDTLAAEAENREIFRYAAGGFRDFTRIAASDPTMWHDIFIANREAVLHALEDFTQGLQCLQDAIQQRDSQTMLGIFSRARAAREHFSRMLEQRAYLEPMQPHTVTFTAGPGQPLHGEIRVPGDKSISHRAIMLGALADGVTRIEGFLEGEDSLATVQAFRDMGVVIEGPHQGRVTLYGVGMHGLQAPPGPLYLGNSGTSMRLLSGLLAAQPFDVTLTGDASLTARPMNRVAVPLRAMGARIETAAQGRPPLTLQGGQALQGIHYDMPVASAQVKSSLLLAGLYAKGETRVREPATTRDHTERMLRGFGYPLEVDDGNITLQGGGSLQATTLEVPADISSAAFFMVAATLVPGSNLLIRHVGVNPTRIGVINILRAMGARLSLENARQVGGEPVADIRVQSAPLQGIDIPADQVPLAIDEFPVLFIAAACARGQTRLRGAEELRVKESDRIQVMADGLTTLGIAVETRKDGIVIRGGTLQGGRVDSQGDHRVAMAFVVAAQLARGTITIDDCANINTSFPNFIELARAVGLQVAPAAKGA